MILSLNSWGRLKTIVDKDNAENLVYVFLGCSTCSTLRSLNTHAQQFLSEYILHDI
jgi:hypothetical protein